MDNHLYFMCTHIHTLHYNLFIIIIVIYNFLKILTGTIIFIADQNLTLSNKLRIVSRLEWVAAPPVEEPTPLKTPVPLVIIHHTATENCTSQANCVLQVRLIQSFHMESRQWWDIGME